MTDDGPERELITAIGDLWQARSPEVISDLEALVRALLEIPEESRKTDPERLSARRDAHRLVGVLGVFGQQEAALAVSDIEHRLASEATVDPIMLGHEAHRIASSVRKAARDSQQRR